MRVLKFGGSSMENEETWVKVYQVIQSYDHPVVIVSATAETTKQLVTAAKLSLKDIDQANLLADQIKERHKLIIQNFFENSDIEASESIFNESIKWIDTCIHSLKNDLYNISTSNELNPKTFDSIASLGEKLSSRLFTNCGKVFGLNTKWVDARKIIKTDSNFGNARPQFSLIKKAVAKNFYQFDENYAFVMGGYYGSDHHNNTTTLGFDGSDYSASLVGSALDATAIEIWTNVNGIFSCDPLVVENAVPLRELSFSEATKLAHFGAKVLHPSTMNPAKQKNIPILVKNLFEPTHPGTTIQRKAPIDNQVKAMTFLEDVKIITLNSSHKKTDYEFIASVFKVLQKYHTMVKVVQTTDNSISLVLETKQFDADLIKSLEQFGPVSVKNNQSVISLIGCRFKNADISINSVLSAMQNIEIFFLNYNNKKKYLNIAISKNDLMPAINAIHCKLFEPMIV